MAVEDNFDDSNDTGWNKDGGTWTASGGQYNVASNPGAKSLLDTSFSDVIYEADVAPGSTGNAGLVFRYPILNGYGCLSRLLCWTRCS